MSLFLCLSGIPLGRYCRKSPAKSRGFGKKNKKRGCSYGGGLSIERGFKPSALYVNNNK